MRLQCAVPKSVVDFLFIIIEFLFHYLLRLRRYQWKSVEVGIFRTGGSLSANISGGTGQFAAIPVGRERLDISLFRTVLRY